MLPNVAFQDSDAQHFDYRIYAPQWSEDVARIWEAYADFLAEKFDIEPALQMMFCNRADKLLDSEFTAQGSKNYYGRSFLYLMRLVQYNATVMDKRADRLDAMTLPEPILDYGAGCGFTLLYLKQRGYNQLYAYDVDGPVTDLVMEYLSRFGIQRGIPDNPGTVLCTNVLEHLDDPLSVARRLHAMGGRLIANCDDHDGVGHTSSREARLETIAFLRDTGSLYE